MSKINNKKRYLKAISVGLLYSSFINSSSVSSNFFGILPTQKGEKEEKKRIEDLVKKHAINDPAWKKNLKAFWNLLPFTDPYVFTNEEAKKEMGEKAYINNLQKLFPGDEYKFNRDNELRKYTNSVIADSLNKQLLEYEKQHEEALAEASDAWDREYAEDRYQSNLKSINHQILENAMENQFTNILTKPSIKKNFVYVVGGLIASFASGAVKDLANMTGKVYYRIKDSLKRVFSKPLSASNYEERLEKLRELLKSNVFGQDEAVDKIIDLMKAHFSNSSKSSEYENGLFMYFIGDPGVGKSLVMNLIKDFFKIDSIEITMDDVQKDNGNNANTVLDRIFKPIVKDNGKEKKLELTDASRKLSYPGAKLIFIDEIDKMTKYDYQKTGINPNEVIKSGEKLPGSSMLEAIRSFVDYSIFNGAKRKGSIVIASSNESEKDIENYESSMTQRIKESLVVFKKLDSQGIARTMKQKLSMVAGKYYKEKKKIDVSWDEKDLKDYADVLYNQNLSGRPVSRRQFNLTPLIDDFYKNNKDVKKIVLHYSKSENKVYVASK